jgi:hypothetical protein
MRKIPLFLVLLVLACKKPTINKVSNQIAGQLKTVYFMDTTAKVCFGGIYYKDASPIIIDPKTFSCVPCESLKNVPVTKIGN